MHNINHILTFALNPEVIFEIFSFTLSFLGKIIPTVNSIKKIILI